MFAIIKLNRRKVMETINHLYEQTDKYQSVTSEEIVSNLSTYNITEI